MPNSTPTRSNSSDTHTAWQQASDWFGRTIAIVLVMVGPGLAGGWLDSKLGTKFITMIGFAIGMGLAVVALVIFSKIKPVVGDRKLESETANATIVTKRSELPPSEQPLPKLPGADVWESKD